MGTCFTKPEAGPAAQPAGGPHPARVESSQQHNQPGSQQEQPLQQLEQQPAGNSTAGLQSDGSGWSGAVSQPQGAVQPEVQPVGEANVQLQIPTDGPPQQQSTSSETPFESEEQNNAGLGLLPMGSSVSPSQQLQYDSGKWDKAKQLFTPTRPEELLNDLHDLKYIGAGGYGKVFKVGRGFTSQDVLPQPCKHSC